MAGTIPDTVNAEQRRAISHGEGPLLIVAGAGTGKTTVITQRIAWLILEKKVPTDGILALTFTDKASTEMEERVDQLLPYGYVNLWVSTFHAFCERVLREHALDIGLPADFRLLSQTEQWLLVRRNFDRFELDYYRPLGNPTRFIAALVRHFSRLEDEDISPEDYLAYARSLKLDRDEEKFAKKKDADAADEITEAQRIGEVAAAYATYRQLLLDEGCLDFGTMITYTLALFKKRPSILKQYQEQFQYVLVDEFQDTNWAQFELIKLLAAPRNNLTVVGDDDQSIYKFRGASVSNIIEFKHDYPDCVQVVLTKNYRSRQQILDLSYAFIQRNNPNRLEAALNVAVKPPNKAGAKKKKAVVEPVSKKLAAFDTEPGVVEFIHTVTQEEEARTVADRIVALQKAESLDWKEFAVLVRANDQAEQYVHALELAGVPYQFVASKGLYRKTDVLDVVAFMQLLDNYHESTALYRMLELPSFGVKAEDVIELNAFARRKAVSLYQTLVQSRIVPNLSASSRKGIDEILHLVRSGAEYARTHAVTQTCLFFLEKAGVLKDLGKRSTPNIVERVAAIRKFLGEVADFEKAHPRATVREFLEFHALRLESGDAGSLAGTSEPDVDAVRIMTVHGAKGLEFGHVFVVQLVDRRFPTTERKDPIEVPEPLVREILPEGDVHLQEERRLLYVAMTRAKRGLYLTAAEDYGGVRAKKPSRFLYELGFVQEDPKKEPKLLARLEHKERTIVGGSDLRFLGTKFSFSALRSYEKCPWQFRYSYVLKVPVSGNAQFSYGETMHTTLQKFFELVRDRSKADQGDLFGAKKAVKKDAPVTLDELLALYESSFIDQWYDTASQRDEFRERGRTALKAFHEKNIGSLPTVLGLEQGFNLKLDRYVVGGKIDRIDKLGYDDVAKQDIVGIVDYKSGHKRESMERADKYQLYIYALAAQDPHILNAKVGKLTYYFLDDNVGVDLSPSDKELEATTTWILSKIDAIVSGDFEPTPGEWCKYCDFKNICEFRSA